MNERSLSIPQEDAAVAILQEAPETWQPIPEDWGDLRTRMFNTLLRSGLVEYLGTIRFTKASGESAIAVIRWKGSGDYFAVLNTEVKKFRPMWAASHKVSVSRQQPEFWRITADGEVARFGLSQGLQLVLRERSPCLVIERFTEGASDFGREGSPILLAAAQATIGDIVIQNYVTIPPSAPPVVNINVPSPIQSPPNGAAMMEDEDGGTVVFTVTKAARYIGMSEKTVRRYVTDGILNADDMGEGQFRFDLRELKAHRDANKRKP